MSIIIWIRLRKGNNYQMTFNDYIYVYNESETKKMRIIDILKKWNRVLQERVQKIIFQIKLWRMNGWWYYTGASSWELFPPSFYYTHTKEEIEHITAETVGRIQKLINEME